MSSRSRDLQDRGHDGSDSGQEDEAEGTHRSERPPTDVTVANRLIITGIMQSSQPHKVQLVASFPTTRIIMLVPYRAARST